MEHVRYDAAPDDARGSMYCTHCGHENPADANFCGQCGRRISKVGDATTGALRIDEQAEVAGPEGTGPTSGEMPETGELASAVAELDPGSALLVVVRGPNQGARFLLDRDVTTVGRHPDSDIFLDDITVSRRHAEFGREGSEIRVRDTGSLNGTYVNGVRADEERLATGDEVQVGKFKLVAFLAESDA
jgi:pSer/pThr/pTyr-binding forkhead associated (FHA) protein